MLQGIIISTVSKLLAVKFFTNIGLFYYVWLHLTYCSGKIEINEMIKNILKRQVSLLFIRVLEWFFVRENFSSPPCSMVCRYAWIHNFHYVHTLECNKWFHYGWKLLYIIYFFQQTFVWVLLSTPCSFCWFFSKILRPNVLLQWALPLCLLSSACCVFVF